MPVDADYAAQKSTHLTPHRRLHLRKVLYKNKEAFDGKLGLMPGGLPCKYERWNSTLYKETISEVSRKEI